MIIKTIKELRAILTGKTQVGFVPTMGYLHEGHLSLIRRAKKECGFVVVSIFVNPTQFAPNEDFDSYPRDLDRDYKLAIRAGADIIFNPEVEEMYVEGASAKVIVEGDISQKLCGASRPTHFNGVTTVVATLFHIVKPTKVFFGQKDAQQSIIIQKMVRDLHMDLEIVICPIVREEDGLAMSSRNIYLNKLCREQAVVLNQSLKLALKATKSGELNVSILKQLISNHINTASEAIIDYVDILSAYDLSEIHKVNKKTLAAVAVKFGDTRLIDNIYLER